MKRQEKVLRMEEEQGQRPWGREGGVPEGEGSEGRLAQDSLEGFVPRWAFSAQIKAEASAWLPLLTPSDLGPTMTSPAMGSPLHPVSGARNRCGRPLSL